MKKLLGLAAFASACSAAMATCYVLGLNCLCITTGACYGNQTPTGCNVPTCLIADSNGYGPNVCAGAGSFTARVPVGTTTCFVSLCRIYNNCTHTYVQPPNGCNAQVTNYGGTGSNCL